MGLQRIISALKMAWAERKQTPVADLKRSEATFLPSELEILHSPTHPLPRVLGYWIVSLSVLGLAWSIIGKVELVAVAEGKIVSAGHTKLIQPSAKGTVTSILAHEGESVKAGQTLVILDAVEQSADLRKINEQWQQAKLDQLRTAALLNMISGGSRLELEKDDRIERGAVQLALSSAKAQLGEYQSKMASLLATKDQRIAAEAETNAAIDQAQKMLPIIRQREADYQELADKNYVPNHAAQDRHAQRIQMEGELSKLQQRKAENAAAIKEALNQLSAYRAEFAARLAAANEEAASKVAQLEQELQKARSVAEKQVLKSPVDGVVQQLAVHTVGGVVTEAQALMYIVPNDADVVVEAWVQNKDIGFVEPKQKASVKVATFEHMKYGVIPATVLSVSADAIMDEKRGLGYLARIKLNQSSMKIGNRTVNLGPGLEVTSEINIGTKSVFSYIVSPIYEAVTSAAPR